MLSYRECGILLKKSRNMRFFHRHKKRLRKKDHCMYRKFGKRILGIILSGCGIVTLSPIYLLVALAIVLDDPGPVFFRQKRVGIKHLQLALQKSP